MNTTLVTKQIKYQQWAQMVAEQKASGLTVQKFCDNYGIGKPLYYYRLRKLREVCLKSMNISHPEIVPLSGLLEKNTASATVL
ncbi:MAG: hypothetical protein FWE25_02980 [Lachnospiraceae bacterium]|nr:hypothetical protein [Lachnospiraceae bacterium]